MLFFALSSTRFTSSTRAQRIFDLWYAITLDVFLRLGCPVSCFQCFSFLVPLHIILRHPAIAYTSSCLASSFTTLPYAHPHPSHHPRPLPLHDNTTYKRTKGPVASPHIRLALSSTIYRSLHPLLRQRPKRTPVIRSCSPISQPNHRPSARVILVRVYLTPKSRCFLFSFLKDLAFVPLSFVCFFISPSLFYINSGISQIESNVP